MQKKNIKFTFSQPRATNRANLGYLPTLFSHFFMKILPNLSKYFFLYLLLTFTLIHFLPEAPAI
jgi:hypothetical protein